MRASARRAMLIRVCVTCDWTAGTLDDDAAGALVATSLRLLARSTRIFISHRSVAVDYNHFTQNALVDSSLRPSADSLRGTPRFSTLFSRVDGCFCRPSTLLKTEFVCVLQQVHKASAAQDPLRLPPISTQAFLISCRAESCNSLLLMLQRLLSDVLSSSS